MQGGHRAWCSLLGLQCLDLQPQTNRTGFLQRGLLGGAPADRKASRGLGGRGARAESARSTRERFITFAPARESTAIRREDDGRFDASSSIRRSNTFAFSYRAQGGRPDDERRDAQLADWDRGGGRDPRGGEPAEGIREGEIGIQYV